MGMWWWNWNWNKDFIFWSPAVPPFRSNQSWTWYGRNNQSQWRRRVRYVFLFFSYCYNYYIIFYILLFISAECEWAIWKEWNDAAVRFFFDFNQFGHEDKWGPPIFKIALKNYFTSIPSDKSRGTENHKSLRI